MSMLKTNMLVSVGLKGIEYLQFSANNKLLT